MNQYQEPVVAQTPVLPPEIVMAADLDARPDMERPVKQVQRGRLVFQAPTMEASDYCYPCCFFRCTNCCMQCIIWGPGCFTV